MVEEERESGRMGVGRLMIGILGGGWVRWAVDRYRYRTPSNSTGFGSAAIERVCCEPVLGDSKTDGRWLC